MKTVKEKQILVGADFAGFPLKEAETFEKERMDSYGCWSMCGF